MSGRDIRDIYVEPLSIGSFLEDERAKKIMMSALNLAKMFHDEHGMCPVVQQGKMELYCIDYYFLVFAIVNYVRTVEFAEDEEIGEFFAQKIIGDFVKDPKKKSMQLLVNIFDYKNILFSNKDKKWVIALQRYITKNSGKRFLISGVTLGIGFIKSLNPNSLKLLKKMSNRDNFVLEKVGPTCFQKEDGMPMEEVVFSFKSLM